MLSGLFPPSVQVRDQDPSACPIRNRGGEVGIAALGCAFAKPWLRGLGFCGRLWHPSCPAIRTLRCITVESQCICTTFHLVKEWEMAHDGTFRRFWISGSPTSVTTVPHILHGACFECYKVNVWNLPPIGRFWLVLGWLPERLSADLFDSTPEQSVGGGEFRGSLDFDVTCRSQTWTCSDLSVVELLTWDSARLCLAGVHSFASCSYRGLHANPVGHTGLEFLLGRDLKILKGLARLCKPCDQGVVRRCSRLRTLTVEAHSPVQHCEVPPEFHNSMVFQSRSATYPHCLWVVRTCQQRTTTLPTMWLEPEHPELCKTFLPAKLCSTACKQHCSSLPCAVLTVLHQP